MKNIGSNVQSTVLEQKKIYRLLENYEKLISEDCAILITDQMMYKKEQELFDEKNIKWNTVIN